jgi:predicted nucleic acid-binding protein
MDAKIYAVIDTNVLVSALFSISGNSNPSIIVRKIIDGVITPLYNEDILDEYEEVLNRDKFPFWKTDIDWMISIFLDYGISLGRTAISDKVFLDKDDIVFYEVALSKEDSFLATGNIKHFPKKPFIVTPAEMLTIIDEIEAGPGRILNEPAGSYGK